MTISNEVTSVSYVGNGATTVFSYAFLLSASNIVVQLLEISTGVVTPVIPTAYSVTGLDNVNGGTVTYPLSGAALASTFYIVIRRKVPYTQTTSLTNQDGFYPGTVESALDQIVKQTQQLAQKTANVVQYSITDSPVIVTLPPAATRASKYFSFDVSGNPTVTDVVVGSVPVNAAIVPLLASASIAAFVAALGVLLGTAGAVSTGAANAQAVAATGYVLAAGTRTTFIAGFTNTSAATLNVNSTGAVAIMKQGTNGLSALVGTEITVGTLVDTEYNGTFHILLKSTETLAGFQTNIASASTVDLGTLGTHNANVTGTVTVLNFGSSAITDAPVYYLTFAAACLITHNISLIICPGSQNILTAAGDTCQAEYLGAGVWRIRAYTRASGKPIIISIQNYLTGLTLSYSSATVFGIAAGQAMDSTNVSLMAIASAYTKTTAAWAVGTGNGGLDTGTIGATSWYHVYIIQRLDTGVCDYIYSLSASTPILPANYTIYRRIGSIKTAASQWVNFTQIDNEFIWAAQVSDGFTGGTASRNLGALTVPTGVRVIAKFRASIFGAGGSVAAALTSPFEADIAPLTSCDFAVATGQNAGGLFAIMTNTSAQIGIRGNIVTALALYTIGWSDTRGR